MYDDVGRVSAALCANGTELSPEEVSAMLGIAPEYAHRVGQPILNASGKQVDTRKTNYWMYGTSALVKSKDLDEHLRALLTIFVPRADAVHELAKRSEVYVSAIWESAGLMWGAGPIISAASTRDIGVLGVEFHFDVYCSLEHEFSGSERG